MSVGLLQIYYKSICDIAFCVNDMAGVNKVRDHISGCNVGSERETTATEINVRPPFKLFRQ